MKDLVVGCITNYNFDKIKYWVNSLDKSGYTGDKAMLCYNIDYDTCEELVKRGFTIFAFKKNDEKRRVEYKDQFSIVVERFIHQWIFLKEFTGKYRYIVSTDVKDVIFQSNPSVWLENNIGNKKINVGSESIAYKDEDWGRNNLVRSFGDFIYDHNQNNIIYNAGTIAGEFDTMIDLFLNIYLVCNGTQHYIQGGGGPDQAALNVLLNTKTYRDVTNFCKSEDGWAAQLGTTGPQVYEKNKEKLSENVPVVINGKVCTSDQKVFTLVHQYDRIPEWKKIIESQYE